MSIKMVTMGMNINPLSLSGCLIITHDPNTSYENYGIKRDNEFGLLVNIMKMLVADFCSKYTSNDMFRNGIFTKHGECYFYEENAHKRLKKIIDEESP